MILTLKDDTLQDDTYFTRRYLLYKTILTLQDDDTYFARRYLLCKTILTLQVKEAGGDLGMRLELLAKFVSMIGVYTVILKVAHDSLPAAAFLEYLPR